MEPIVPAQTSLRLLLAEDNEVNRRVTVGMLEPRGHRVTVVGDGQTALHRVITGDFDAVLLDVQMPEMDGLQVARAIRRLPRDDKRRLPIIALTAHAMPGDRQRCLESGMNAYLAKPFSAEGLYSLVESVVAQKPLPPQRRPKAPAADQVLDLDDLRRRTRGDMALIRELIELFESRAPSLLDDMDEAIAAKDGAALCRAAHGLKGSAAMLAAVSVHERSLEIEQLGRLQRFGDAGDALADLRQRIEQLRLHLAEI